MNSGERLFWVMFSVSMFMSTVLVKAGALHHFWPDYFAPPEICVKQALLEPATKRLPRESNLPEVAKGAADDTAL